MGPKHYELTEVDKNPLAPFLTELPISDPMPIFSMNETYFLPSFGDIYTGTMVCEHRIVWPIVDRHKVVWQKIPSIYDRFIWQYFDRWSLVLYL